MKFIEKIIGITFVIIVVILLIGFAAFAIWTSQPAQPMPEALAALQSDDEIQVDTETWLIFRPRKIPPTAGLIIYPGGLVDARAYAPTARAIAKQGYHVVIVPMPFNLAFLGTDDAQQVMTVAPNIHKWAIAGHSLGGVAAASFIKSHPDSIMKALILWASYPSDGDSLVNRTDLKAVSISATNDLLSTPAKIDVSRALLPPTTQYVKIEGGNHAQFGWYGTQAGDGNASISRQQQQDQIVKTTIDVLLTLR